MKESARSRMMEAARSAKNDPSISVAEMARASSYSVSRFRELFHEAIGQSAMDYLTNVRIEKAKELLRQTQLDTAEVALEAGFGTYNRFAIAFKKQVGTTPSAFRKSGSDSTSSQRKDFAGKETLWFHDNFESSFVGDFWHQESGNWQQMDGIVSAKRHSQTYLVLKRQLPENFRIEFEARLHRQGGLLPGDLMVELRDHKGKNPFCLITIGEQGNSFGSLERRGIEKQRNSRARVKESSWQKIELRVWDNMLTFKMDGETLFSFVDPFPIPYPHRCTVVVGAWQSAFSMRDFKVFDLGFLPVSPTVRRADSLYNADLFDQARAFYMRLLETGPAPLDAVELRYKIGMCFLQISNFDQADDWLSKVTGVGNNLYWLRQAQAALLQSLWGQGDHAAFRDQCRDLFGIEELQSDIREVIRLAIRSASRFGFRQREMPLRQLLLDIESEDSVPALSAQMGQALVMPHLHQYRKAEAILSRVLEHPNASSTQRTAARFNLADLYAYRGLFDESDHQFDAIRTENAVDYNLARCDASQAHNLRGRGMFPECLDLYLGISEKFWDVDTWVRFGRLEAALVHGMLGDLDRADQIMAMAGLKAHALRHRFGYAFLKGDLGKAAMELLGEGRNPALDSGGAESQIKAAIMFHLDGFEPKARSLLKETVKRYPPDRWYYNGDLARRLLQRRPVDLDGMPGIGRNRSEMMFVLGLWYEKNGDAAEAQRMFKAAAGEDPTNRWPAWLARKKVSSIQ